MWISKFGTVDYCNDFTSMTLVDADEDYEPNFDNWQNIAFGGWKEPYAKVYGSDTICGIYNLVAWK